MGIHMGDNTHHHDHVITFNSFKTIKAMVSVPEKLIPDDDDEIMCLDICYYLYLNI